LNRDWLFLSRQYETYQLPREKLYLLKYFDSPIQEAFLKYFFLFGDTENFLDHTGFYCQERWVKLLHKKLRILETANAKARAEVDLAGLVVIETGKFKYKL
jgi:hypothetical protein